MVNGLTNAEYLRDLRAKAAARGDCSMCRARPARQGRRICVECADRCKEENERMIEEGRCESCCKPLPLTRRKTGHRQCGPCQKKNNKKSYDRAKRLVEEGKCRTCSRPREQLNRKSCNACLERNRKYK